MKFLYIGSFGSEDPTRAGLSFVMAKGAKEAGHDVEVALQGDAVVLSNEAVAEERVRSWSKEGFLTPTVLAEKAAAADRVIAT